jgi:hypothetical protein
LVLDDSWDRLFDVYLAVVLEVIGLILMNPGVGFVLFVIIEAFLEALTFAIFVALVTERVVALVVTFFYKF